MSHIFTEKINKKKVILYRTESGIRIIVGKEKMFFDQLECSIQTYVDYSRALRRSKNIKYTQRKMNFGIRFIICGYSCTVGQAFRLYNEIIDLWDLDNQKYTKLNYEMDQAREISPSKTN